ncbi:hypothetical protein ANCCAN_13709, partial [Ancylostoma caninum]
LFQEKSDKSSRELEVQLLDARNILRSRFHYCTSQWQDEDFPRDHLRSGLVTEYWHEALHTARELYPDSLECLMELKPLLQKHKRLAQAVDQRRIDEDEKISASLDEFLTRNQVQELRYLHEHGHSDSVEKALDQYFEGLPSSRKNTLIAEFLDYDSKPKRVQRDTIQPIQILEYDDEVLEPEPLRPEWLAWQTPRHVRRS